MNGSTELSFSHRFGDDDDNDEFDQNFSGAFDLNVGKMKFEDHHQCCCCCCCYIPVRV